MLEWENICSFEALNQARGWRRFISVKNIMVHTIILVANYDVGSISYINPYLSFSMPQIVWNGDGDACNFASFKQLFTNKTKQL